MNKRQTVKFGRVRLARYFAHSVVTGESPRYLVFRVGVAKVGA